MWSRVRAPVAGLPSSGCLAGLAIGRRRTSRAVSDRNTHAAVSRPCLAGVLGVITAADYTGSRFACLLSAVTLPRGSWGKASASGLVPCVCTACQSSQQSGTLGPSLLMGNHDPLARPSRRPPGSGVLGARFAPRNAPSDPHCSCTSWMLTWDVRSHSLHPSSAPLLRLEAASTGSPCCHAATASAFCRWRCHMVIWGCVVALPADTLARGTYIRSLSGHFCCSQITAYHCPLALAT